MKLRLKCIDDIAVRITGPREYTQYVVADGLGRSGTRWQARQAERQDDQQPTYGTARKPARADSTDQSVPVRIPRMHSTFLFSSRCAIVQQDHKKYSRAIGTSRTRTVSAHAERDACVRSIACGRGQTIAYQQIKNDQEKVVTLCRPIAVAKRLAIPTASETMKSVSDRLGAFLIHRTARLHRLSTGCNAVSAREYVDRTDHIGMGPHTRSRHNRTRSDLRKHKKRH
ncbi:hypothetical protein [Burkholderia ambifaria]|uniref:hypothetical protein n=1 Tax=Burkholderia ambifaria TaxID=152480 RepID=UPI0034959D33